jgi:hypothetical protein
MSGVPEDWIITTIVKNYYGESVGFYCEFELFFIWGLISLLPLSAALTSIFVTFSWYFCIIFIFFPSTAKSKAKPAKVTWGRMHVITTFVHGAWVLTTKVNTLFLLKNLVTF